MKNILVQMMAQLTNLSQEEIIAIEESFPIKTFDKSSYLLKEGQIAKEAYFLIEGCVRRYSLVDGEEITHDLYTEGDTVADFNSIANRIPSKFNFLCVEQATLAILNSEKEAELFIRFPRFEAICRVEFEKMMGGKAEQLEAFSKKNPEEKYLQLLEERPDLFNRVPQYQIASYLGIKPETLSRIRKRISK